MSAFANSSSCRGSPPLHTLRIPSAGAESSEPPCWRCTRQADHPPPVRIARHHEAVFRLERWTTSAFAESSRPRRCRWPCPTDHLSLRRELPGVTGVLALRAESPLPSRRVLIDDVAAVADVRATFAVAESALAHRLRPGGIPDRVRFRGKLRSSSKAESVAFGPPPPARRARGVHRAAGLGVWTTSAFAESFARPSRSGPGRAATSAFAESSRTGRSRLPRRSDHLRLRGELGTPAPDSPENLGPPPPSRRAPRRTRLRRRPTRTTSAFAESSYARRARPSSGTDHLRLRGELVSMVLVTAYPSGPPPPSRRAPLRGGVIPRYHRTPSAFAESSDRCLAR